MKTILLFLLFLHTALFAYDGKDLLENIDETSLTFEQEILVKKALNQNTVEVIELNDENLPTSLKENNKIKIKYIKTWLKKADHSSTCLDEYFKLRKKRIAMPLVLLVDTSLGVFVAIASGGWVPTMTASYALIRYFVSETIAGKILSGSYPPGQYPPKLFDGIAVGITAVTLIPYYGIGTFQTIRFFQYSHLLKVIMSSKQLMITKPLIKFRKKYLKKYPMDADKLSLNHLMGIINDADSQGLFCNGDIVNDFNPRRLGKGKKLKQKTALKKEIFAYIHQQLSI